MKYYTEINSDKNGLFTADSFLNYIRRSNNRWWDDEKIDSPWVFRGVGDADNWKLLPAACRPKSLNNLLPFYNKIKNLQPRNNLQGWEQNEHGLEALYWSNAEWEATYQFTSLCTNLGHEVDQIQSSPLSENELFQNSFGHVFSNYKSAMKAQHHGIPTRLLDWTKNPLFAAFFASHPNFMNQGCSAICVWACHKERLKQIKRLDRWISSPFKVHEQPGSENQYLHAQQGLFTELQGAEEYYSIHGNWPAIEDVLDEKVVKEPKDPVLYKIVLGRGQIPRLLTLLDREGINQAALMPTLDKVAQTVMDRWNHT